MISRVLQLDPRPLDSFFLWGPRQTGKSSLLRATYPDALRIDLLSSDEFVRYTRRPSVLRDELAARPADLVVIDEIQKVPALLDEAHWLIENRGTRFVLCGSSARKLRRGHANLLGGRALRRELCGFVSTELGREFDLVRALNHGGLPRHYLRDAATPLLRAYVNDYLKEEIAAEGLVRNLPVFSTFLGAAALADAEQVSYATIARDCGVSAPTVRGYFEILVDTLLGRFLPAFTRRPKRRVAQTPKFYFADVGVAGILAKRGRIEPGSPLFGKALESWIFHELHAYCAYRELDVELSYWRLAGGTEVDFILGEGRCAIEVKATAHAHVDHLKGLRELRVDHPRIGRRILVSLDPRPRRTDDGIEILPATEFLRRLWADEIIDYS
ncbi:MAG: ATP-binding protein [Deltaproteobacteria bacterium]|nr:ATP-binding protein [Deltaproteobacteria bacterium]